MQGALPVLRVGGGENALVTAPGQRLAEIVLAAVPINLMEHGAPSDDILQRRQIPAVAGGRLKQLELPGDQAGRRVLDGKLDDGPFVMVGPEIRRIDPQRDRRPPLLAESAVDDEVQRLIVDEENDDAAEVEQGPRNVHLRVEQVHLDPRRGDPGGKELRRDAHRAAHVDDLRVADRSAFGKNDRLGAAETEQHFRERVDDRRGVLLERNALLKKNRRRNPDSLRVAVLHHQDFDSVDLAEFLQADLDAAADLGLDLLLHQVFVARRHRRHR